jgi:glycosyltransferase involved in cell wall biosynthesis
VVATPVGCVPEVITEGNGFIVRHSVGAVREGMQRMLTSDRQAKSVAARRMAEDHTWAAVASQYLTLFERVLAERTP